MADGSVIIDTLLNSEGFEKGLDGLNGIAKKGLNGITTLAKVTATAVAAIGTAMVGVGVSAVKTADECKGALNTLQAQTGATAEEMEGLKDILLSIYSNNYGESFEDVAESLANVKQQTGLAGQALEDFTKNALILRDTFDMEVTESTRAADMMMKQFGVTGEEAFNLIAQGAQNGLDKNGNMLDSINEYSVHFKQLGLDAEDMFNMMSNGAQKGVFDYDKLGDAIKEFGIRAKDGSDSTKEAFSALGLDADKITQAFANGGEGAEQAFQQVNEALANCDDKVLQNQAGVALWGVMWEDMGADATLALTNVNGTIDQTKDTMQEINAIKYDTFGEALSGIGRQFEVGILIPLGDKILPKLNEFANWFSTNMPNISAAIESGDIDGLMAAIGDMLAQGLLKLNEYMPQFVAGAILLLQSFGQAIVENLPTILETLGQLGGMLLQAFVDLTPQLIMMGGELIKALADGIASNPTAITDSVSKIIQSLGDALSSAMPAVLEAGSTIISSLIQGIGEAMPQLLTTGLDMITNIIDGIINNLDTIIDAGLQLIEGLVDGLEQALPKLIEKGPELIGKLVDKMLENLPKIVDTATKIVVKLATALIQNAPKLLQSAQTLVITLVNSLISHLPQIIETGFKMVGELAAGIIKNIPAIIKGITEIITNIKNPLAKVDLLTIGKQIIQGLINGIKSMVKSVGGAISSLCSDAVKAAKDALGIHSPSRVFKDDVGKWVGAGMAQGINDSAPEASKATADMCNSVLANGKAFLEKQKAQDKAWSKSKKEQYEAQKTALYDYIERKKEANQLSLEDEKYIYQQLLKAAKGNQKEIQEIKDKILEADEEAYQKRLANSKQFVADKKYYNQMSLQDELAAYERMKDYSKDHKEETKEIEKEIYRVKKEIREQEIQDVKDANAKILDELKERVDAEKDIINGNRDSQLDALQAQIDAIDEAEEKRQNSITAADYSNSIQEIQRQLAEALDPEEQQRLNEQLFEKQQAFDEWKYQQELKDKKEAIRAQMDEVRANADEQIAVKEEQYQQEKSMIEQQQEMMIAAIQAGQQAMVQAVKDGGQQSLNIQDANAIMAMGINKSLTQDKEDNLNQQYEAVIDNEGKCAQAVEDACVEMYRKNYQMGAQMANGIADGILNQTWRAVKAIGMLCDKMIQEAQSKLDIHSPSRVFRKMGEFVDQGFSGGIDGGSGGVVNSMSAMCRKLTNAVNVDDLVGKMNAAVNGEIAITGGKFASGASSSVTTNTTTTNNNSSIPITVNNYGSTNEGKDLGRELGNQVARRLRGRGIVPC